MRLEATQKPIKLLLFTALVLSISAFAQSAIGQGPEEVQFRQTVITPSGTALGGAVDLTLRSDGTYKAAFSHAR